MNGEHFAESSEKKKKLPLWQLLNIIIVTVVFAAVTVFMLLLERPTESQTEKRMLATFPVFSVDSFFDGSYTKGISEYFNDTVPFRDDFKQISASVKKYMGIQLGGATTYGGLVVIGGDETTTASVTEPPVTQEPVVVTDANGVIVTTTPEVTTEEVTTTTEPKGNEIAPGVFTNGQIVFERDGHYWGISMYSGGSGDNYAKYLNSFRKGVSDDVNVYCAIIPTASAYYTPQNFEQYNASHLDSINSVYGQLDSGIKTVDAYGVLGAHTDEYIYTRTDHHWQPLGAYYVAQEFAKVAGVPFETLDKMKPVEVEDYVGSIYSFTQDANLLNDPEIFTYYKPQNDYTCYYYDTAYNFDYEFPFFVPMNRFTAYATFMAGDEKIVRVETDVDNGRKLIVIKDSYGNAEIPFFMNSYEEIYVVDMRYFDLNIFDFIKEQGITDVLFTCCTFSAVGPNAEGALQIQNN